MNTKQKEPDMSHADAAWVFFWTVVVLVFLALTGAFAATGNLGSIGTAIVVHAILSNLDKIIE